jgi:tetratricopeptide (TPR) repeat protein
VAAALALDDDDPATASAHAEVARRLSSRLAVVREATGVVAYQAGDYERALRDLQAARRIGGSVSALAVMADCERALGRPERALDIAASAAPAELEVGELVELLIVTAGARLDLGQPEAAVATLRTRHLEARSAEPWQERLWFAYAQALTAAGREEEGRTWMRRAAGHPAGATDAAERVARGGGASVADRGPDTVGTAGDPGAAGTARGDDVGEFLDLDEVVSSPMLGKGPDENARRQLRAERGGLDRHQQPRRDGVQDVRP